MKTTRRTLFAALLALCLVTSAFAQARNRLDITLEGPWILYEDHNFRSGNAIVDVLIAMAPGVADDANKMAFHSITLWAGDGYRLKQSGIYCLTFDSTCGPKGAKSLLSQEYSQTLPILARVNSQHVASPSWDWVSASRTGNDVIALILPMPDSYSNDGVWHMRFGSSFSADGSAYGPDTQHSIGAQLHYTTGPKIIDIFLCHSLGGLIVKELLLDNPHYAKKVPFIVFMRPPGRQFCSALRVNFFG